MVPSNVVVGQVELLANGDFWTRIADTGYVLVIGMPSEIESDLLTTNSMFSLTAELFFPVPADVSYDFGPVYNQLAMLWTGWATNDVWRYGENRTALKMKAGKPERRFHEKPVSKFLGGLEAFICTIPITFSYPFISDQVAAPYDEPPVG
jgi:hypothetical protein